MRDEACPIFHNLWEAKGVNELYPERVRSLLVQSKSRKKQNDGQLTLLFKEEPA